MSRGVNLFENKGRCASLALSSVETAAPERCGKAFVPEAEKTPPLRRPVELQGGVRIRLFVESDSAYSDVFMRLCDVGPSGKSINARPAGPARSGAGGGAGRGERVVETTLPDTAHRFRAGHRIRLQVSGGAHPRYARNLGTGEPVGQASHGVPTNHRICHGGSAPSSFTLSVA